MTEELRFRPHARLLTMLGEQLIKNDQIALVELVKNAYDADASVVRVDFRGFGPNFESGPQSSIVITDNGTGMSSEVLETAWMSPATPEKLRRKRIKPTTARGRILQGEKGIGRFAVFKLGASVVLTTREAGASEESTLAVDLTAVEASMEDDGTILGVQAWPTPESIESRKVNPPKPEMFLDEIRATLTQRQPTTFSWDPNASGTEIVISGVRSKWSLAKVEAVFNDLERLQPVMWRFGAEATRPDFVVNFERDGAELPLSIARQAEFEAILDHAVLTVTNGRFDVEHRSISFDLNGRPFVLSVDDSEVRALKPFVKRFGDAAENPHPEFDCGPFSFEFHIFDFSNLAPVEYQLDRNEKDLLREHRVYLYRDGVRVYPYGDPEDDWLQIDVLRGTQSARSIFSNDQTVGFVSISQRENPKLQDKTNREGLLENGAATGDFVALIQTVLAYLRTKPYERYASANRRAHEKRKPIRERVDEHFNTLRTSALTLEAQQSVDALERAISQERAVSELQLERTQDLAGVGLSVETASHDLIAASSEALRIAKQVHGELRQLGLTNEDVYTLSTSLLQRLEFIDARFQDVQGLFVSTRKKRGPVDAAQLARRVKSMYARLHKSKNITFEIDDELRVVGDSTEGAVLQSLINLVDNATFWLLASPAPRMIKVFAVDSSTLAVSDSGPGVSDADEPFIFEPFYSGKGDAGKGLGLYIAREAGARNGFDVQLAEGPPVGPMLGGATFTMKFHKKEG